MAASNGNISIEKCTKTRVFLGSLKVTHMYSNQMFNMQCLLSIEIREAKELKNVYVRKTDTVEWILVNRWWWNIFSFCCLLSFLFSHFQSRIQVWLGKGSSTQHTGQKNVYVRELYISFDSQLVIFLFLFSFIVRTLV